MAWVYLDPDFPDHPKVVLAGPEGGWLFVCGLAYCRRFGTPGVIPKEALGRLTALRNPRKIALRLCDVALWDDEGDVYRVHSWGEWNASADARSEAGRKAAQARWSRVRADANGNANAYADPMPTQCEGIANAYADRCPIPYPLPRDSSQSVQDPRPPADDDPIEAEAHRRTAARAGVQNPAAYAAAVAADLRANPTRGADVNHHDRTAAAARAREERDRLRREHPCGDCDGLGQTEDAGAFTECPTCTGLGYDRAHAC